MERQGYVIEDYDKFSINEVNSMKINNQLDMLLEKKDENDVTKRSLPDIGISQKHVSHWLMIVEIDKLSNVSFFSRESFKFAI